MKTLFIVNTVYQLMMAINMRMHNIPNNESDLVVSDHTQSLKDYIENLKKSNLFSNVFYHESLNFNKYFWAIPNNKKENIRKKRCFIYGCAEF